MDFSKLGNYLDSLYEVKVPGCDIMICKDHEPVYRHMAGFRDSGRTEPVRGDEIYCLYSATKVVTTCAVMQLLERGLLSLDDPVSRYLPAFAKLSPARPTLTQGLPVVSALGVWVSHGPYHV